MTFEFDDFDVRERFFHIEEKAEKLKSSLNKLSPKQKKLFDDITAKAYIFHDAAIEGLVISADEIASVFHSNLDGMFMRGRLLQEISNHKQELIKIIDHANKNRLSGSIYRASEITIDLILAKHEALYNHISKKDPGKLRSQHPLHLAYFHNLIDPSKVKEQLNLLCIETRESDFRAQHPINQAAYFHYKFMQIFPFIEGSGKVGRLFLNSYLLQGGYNYVIIHSCDRQAYYETLQQSNEKLRELILDSMESTIDSQTNFLTEADLNRSSGKTIYKKPNFVESNEQY